MNNKFVLVFVLLSFSVLGEPRSSVVSNSPSEDNQKNDNKNKSVHTKENDVIVNQGVQKDVQKNSTSDASQIGMEKSSIDNLGSESGLLPKDVQKNSTSDASQIGIEKSSIDNLGSESGLLPKDVQKNSTSDASQIGMEKSSIDNLGSESGLLPKKEKSFLGLQGNSNSHEKTLPLTKPSILLHNTSLPETELSLSCKGKKSKIMAKPDMITKKNIILAGLWTVLAYLIYYGMIKLF